VWDEKGEGLKKCFASIFLMKFVCAAVAYGAGAGKKKNLHTHKLKFGCCPIPATVKLWFMHRAFSTFLSITFYYFEKFNFPNNQGI
jgi:hypothetical protein